MLHANVNKSTFGFPILRIFHTDPESTRLVQKVQKSKSLYRKIALITFVEDFLEHKKLIFFIA